MTIKQLIKGRDNILDDGYKDLLDEVGIAEEAFLKLVIKLINKLDTSGGKIKRENLTRSEINKLSQQLIDLLKKTKYAKVIAEFEDQFDELTDLNVALVSQVNNIKVAKGFLELEKALVKNTVVDQLASFDNLESNFVNGLKRILGEGILKESNRKDLVDEISNYVTGNKNGGTLTRYVRTIAMDTLMQYDRGVQQAIGDKYDLNAYVYTGPIDDKTRPQCLSWVNKKVIYRTEIAAEVARWGGSTGYGSGLTLTKENWARVAGGWGCRHRTTAVRIRDKKDEQRFFELLN